ncbi:AMP-binding protein [Nocardia sp. NPDC056000]|uniref:AMP-binding protein n=1 Tax=Nocardia sp. NPDC056000 TaxID=3345674 RepID=UPI0035DC5B41
MTPVTTAVENVLISAVEERLNGSGELRILDKRTGAWSARPWADLYERSVAIAARLQSTRQHETQTVAVIGEPNFETLAAICGAWLAGHGLTVLPGPNRFASSESWAAKTLAQFETLGVADVFGYGTALAALDQQLVAQAGTGVRLADPEQVATWGSAPSDFRSTPAHPDAHALYQGTAGSTGTSKTVALSASAVLHHLLAVVQRQQFDRGRDILCSWLPLYHDMGLTMALGGLVTGADTWLAPTSAFAQGPFDWLTWLTESKATITAAPNFAYALLGRYARVAKEGDLSALRMAVNGAEPIDVDATGQFCSELGKFGFDRGAMAASYGLAEATCGITMPVPGTGLRFDLLPATATTPERKLALLGPAFDGVEMRIGTPEHTTDLAGLRAVGEIEFRSLAQMTGYLGDQPVGPDEWIKTGDLGYLVDDQLVVCGRSKELITIAGRNIFPQDVERAVDGVEGVRPGGIVALSVSGGRVRSDRLVIVAEFQGADEAAARGEISDRVAAECGIVPATVDFVEPGSLPKTTSGKLRRVEVAGRYR